MTEQRILEAAQDGHLFDDLKAAFLAVGFLMQESDVDDVYAFTVGDLSKPGGLFQHDANFAQCFSAIVVPGLATIFYRVTPTQSQ
jgi:hypothetical protein